MQAHVFPVYVPCSQADIDAGKVPLPLRYANKPDNLRETYTCTGRTKLTDGDQVRCSLCMPLYRGDAATACGWWIKVKVCQMAYNLRRHCSYMVKGHFCQHHGFNWHDLHGNACQITQGGSIFRVTNETTTVLTGIMLQCPTAHMRSTGVVYPMPLVSSSGAVGESVWGRGKLHPGERAPRRCLGAEIRGRHVRQGAHTWHVPCDGGFARPGRLPGSVHHVGAAEEVVAWEAS